MPINHEDTHTIVDDTEAAARGEFVPSWWNKNHNITDSEGNVLTVDELAAPMNYVNVKNYGAEGDGTTNDHDAIMDAYDESPNLFFPPGTYITSDLLFQGPLVRLLGSGFYAWQDNESYGTGTVLKTSRTEAGTIYEDFVVTIDSTDPNNYFSVGNSVKNLTIDGNGYCGGLIVNWDGNASGYLNNNVFEQLGIVKPYGIGIGVDGHVFRNTFRDIVITDLTPSITDYPDVGVGIYNGPYAVYNLFQGIDCLNTKGFMIYSNGGWNPSYRDISGDGLVWNASYGAIFDNITIEQCYDSEVVAGSFNYLGYSYSGNSVPAVCNRSDGSNAIFDIKLIEVPNSQCNLGFVNHAEKIILKNLTEKTETSNFPQYPLYLPEGSGNIDMVDVPSGCVAGNTYMGVVLPGYNVRKNTGSYWMNQFDPGYCTADSNGAPSTATLTSLIGSPSTSIAGYYLFKDSHSGGVYYRVYCNGSSFYVQAMTAAA